MDWKAKVFLTWPLRMTIICWLGKSSWGSELFLDYESVKEVVMRGCYCSLQGVMLAMLTTQCDIRSSWHGVGSMSSHFYIHSQCLHIDVTQGDSYMFVYSRTCSHQKCKWKIWWQEIYETIISTMTILFIWIKYIPPVTLSLCPFTSPIVNV